MANPKQLFRRNTTWRKQVLRSLVTDVIVYGQIETTETRAKEVRRFVDKMITKAKDGSLNSRRKAQAFLRNVTLKDGTTVLQHLFATLGPKYKDRNGGYTRIFKLTSRRGDGIKMAILKLV